MNILVLGSGAREHAFVHALAKSPTVHKIYACPGNVGMSDTPICKRTPLRSNADLVEYCKGKIDLAVVGSSKFVEEGTVDALVLAGIPVIGPAEDAGKIETSKAFSASFMSRHKIPSPATKIIVNAFEAEQALFINPNLRVIKCDGYSRGSGVVVCNSHEEMLKTIPEMLEEYGAPLVLQEKLSGKECSFNILTDGQQWISFSSCRDYKLVGEGDTGLTTGGMGAVSPSPDLTPELEKEIIDTIVQPTVSGMVKDNLLYKGFLSFQLMLTYEGPKVLEFNARLGDPETQSILTRFRGDLAGLLKDCAMGCLTNVGSEVAFGKYSAVSVVLARANYPEDESCESIITGTDNVQDSLIFYSNCRKAEDHEGYSFKTGRLVSVTSLAETLEEARRLCYDDIGRLELKDVRYRKDIGK